MSHLISHDFQQSIYIYVLFVGLYTIIFGLLIEMDQLK